MISTFIWGRIDFSVVIKGGYIEGIISFIIGSHLLLSLITE